MTTQQTIPVTAHPGSENGLDSARSAPLPPNPGGAECFSPHGWGAGGPPEQLPIPVPLLDLKAQYATIKDEVRVAIDRVLESQHFILGPEVEAMADYRSVVAGYYETLEEDVDELGQALQGQLAVLRQVFGQVDQRMELIVDTRHVVGRE